MNVNNSYTRSSSERHALPKRQPFFRKTQLLRRWTSLSITHRQAQMSLLGYTPPLVCVSSLRLVTHHPGYHTFLTRYCDVGATSNSARTIRVRHMVRAAAVRQRGPPRYAPNPEFRISAWLLPRVSLGKMYSQRSASTGTSVLKLSVYIAVF